MQYAKSILWSAEIRISKLTYKNCIQSLRQISQTITFKIIFAKESIIRYPNIVYFTSDAYG